MSTITSKYIQYRKSMDGRDVVPESVSSSCGHSERIFSCRYAVIDYEK